jgi:short-subunit dehydrogenase
MINALTLISGIVAFYSIVHFGLQKEYVVNNSGLILISGASTGIGRHAAESLAKEGYVVLAGVRKESDYNDISNWNSKDNKGFMIPVKFDVSDHESIVNAIHIVKSEMTKRNLPLVAVVNNAGIGRNTVLEYHSIADAKNLFDINVFGLIDLTQMTLPLLRLSNGRIINVGSVAGFFTLPENGIYSSSKFAVEALTGFNIYVS